MPEMTVPISKDTATPAPSDFIRETVAAHVAEKKYPRIHTRFPPEPNGYLHIGHAKSICLNSGIAHECGGVCNLRLDDTNPAKEDIEYVESRQEDVHWLSAGWADHCLGLKPKGKTPKTQTVNGKQDFYLPATVGISNIEHRTSNIEPFYASDYFDQIYQYAAALIKQGKAFVCDPSPADMETYRGAPDRTGPNTHAP